MTDNKIAFLKHPPTLLITLLSLEVIGLGTYFLLTNFKLLTPKIPIWYAQFFLSDRLDTPLNLFLLPIISLLILILNLVLVEKFLVRQEELLAVASAIFSLGTEVFIQLAIVRIILTSTPSQIIIPGYILKTLLAFTLAYVVGFLATPLVINLATKWKIIDDPEIRKFTHPAILHTKPIPRAGAVSIYLALLLVGLVFLNLSTKIIGIYIGATITVIIGLLDDKYDLNPYLRLFTQVLAALIVVGSGAAVMYLTNPFGGLVWLNQYTFSIGGLFSITLWADLFAWLWIIWVMNMINWSNGVDGQFPGIVSIAAIIIGLLSLRLVPYDPNQLELVILAAIIAGGVLGTLPFNWHPAKIFYGFGNTMVGLVLASIAVLSGAKVATALLVLIVPTFDAVFTILRRIKQKKSPVWGDKNHLHHRLLKLGWSHQRVALFYISTTAIFGILALYASGKYKLLSIIAAVGILAFLLVILKGQLKKSPLST